MGENIDSESEQGVALACLETDRPKCWWEEKFGHSCQSEMNHWTHSNESCWFKILGWVAPLQIYSGETWETGEIIFHTCDTHKCTELSRGELVQFDRCQIHGFKVKGTIDCFNCLPVQPLSSLRSNHTLDSASTDYLRFYLKG